MMRSSGTVGKNSDLFGIGFHFLAVTVVLASAGNVQGSYEKAGQRPEAVGEYFLASANSQELPAVVSETGSRTQEVIGGSVIFEADGTFAWRTLYRYTESGGVHDSESSGRGSYSQQGASITFLFEVGASGLEGTVDGDRLTIRADVPMVYRKANGADEISRASAQPFTVPPGAGRVPPPPPPTGITFGLSFALGYMPGSFEELCDSSVLIVEAHVLSVLAPTENLRYLETDSILSVDRVLKGPESIRQVVISQKGGVLGQYRQLPYQYNLMQQGEHYILFLTEETETNLPDVAGIPRYALTGSWTGIFQIDDSGVHLSPGAADVIREQFEGRSSQDVIAAIQLCSQAKDLDRLARFKTKRFASLGRRSC